MRKCKLCSNILTGLSPLCPSCSQTKEKSEVVDRPEYVFGLQPHAIFCNSCKEVVLLENEYHEQCNSLDDDWYCPVCGHKAWYMQDNEDAYFKSNFNEDKEER